MNTKAMDSLRVHSYTFRTLCEVQLYRENHVKVIKERLIREGKGKLKETVAIYRSGKKREVDCNKKFQSVQERLRCNCAQWI